MRKDRFIAEVLGDEGVLAPSDLYNAQFKTSVIGGYDKGEVDEFLERVGDAFESLIQQVQALRSEVESYRQQVESFQTMESTLRDALVTSQKFGEDVIDSAKRQADALLAEAKSQAARARLDAASIPDALRIEIQQLKGERDRLRTDLRSVIETHLSLLESMEERPAESSGEAALFASGEAPEPLWGPASARGRLSIDPNPWADSDGGEDAEEPDGEEEA